jgi:ATP-binding cassette subfamily C protein LapB
VVGGIEAGQLMVVDGTSKGLVPWTSLTDLERQPHRLLRITGIQHQDSAEATAKSHWFWSVINQAKRLYAEVLLASLLVNLFALATPLFIMNVYDRVVPNQAVNTLWVLASGIGIVFIFDFLMKSVRGYFLDIAGKQADLHLASSTFEHVLNMKMQEHPKRVGSFASQLQEFDQFREFFTSTTLLTLIDLPFVLLFIGLIFVIAGPLGFIPALVLPLVILVSYLAQRRFRPLIQDIFAESARKTAMLVETLHSLEAIKASQAEGEIQARWERTQGTLADLSLRSRLGSLTTLNLIQLIGQIATVALVIAGVYAIQQGALTIGGLIACTILTGRALAPMNQIANILSRYQHAMAAYQTIDHLMTIPGERDFKHQFLHRANLKPAVTFRNVVFSYPGQPHPALNGVDFTIRSGEKVAILGPTGSGKSTVQRLISKLYLPTAGNIQIDQTDLHQIDPVDLRRQISYLPQEPTLLAGNVRDNIRLGQPSASDEAILLAADTAGIKNYFDQHPQGFDFQIGERGAYLSGGQRQGVAIARALINQGDLILLDEPSNAMDRQSEQRLIHELKGHCRDKTLIIVTHRMDLLALVDRIIILQAGKVVADGATQAVLEQLSLANGAKS